MSSVSYVIDLSGACTDPCCNPSCTCVVGTSNPCGGNQLELVIGGTCYDGTFTLTYSSGLGFTNGTATAKFGSCGAGPTYCAEVLIIDVGQASYRYEGSTNPCTTLVTLDLQASDGICEEGGGSWPATLTLEPV